MKAWKPYHAILPSGIVYDMAQSRVTDLKPQIFEKLFCSVNDVVPDAYARVALFMIYQRAAALATQAIQKAMAPQTVNK